MKYLNKTFSVGWNNNNNNFEANYDQIFRKKEFKMKIYYVFWKTAEMKDSRINYGREFHNIAEAIQFRNLLTTEQYFENEKIIQTRMAEYVC